MKKTLLLAVTAGLFTLTTGAFAGDAFMSPKGKEQADSLNKVPGTTADMVDRSVQAGSPKAMEFAQSQRKASGLVQTVDLVHAQRPTMSPKDPRFEMALRSNAVNEVQIAPLK